MERMDINNKKLVDDPFLLASWIAKSMAEIGRAHV